MKSGSDPSPVPSGFNSFFWNREQCKAADMAGLLAGDLNGLHTNQLNRARMRHWLARDGDYGYWGLDMTLSFERAPSAESAGTTTGQITWYDYTGKDLSCKRSLVVGPEHFFHLKRLGISLTIQNMLAADYGPSFFHGLVVSGQLPASIKTGPKSAARPLSSVIEIPKFLKTK